MKKLKSSMQNLAAPKAIFLLLSLVLATFLFTVSNIPIAHAASATGVIVPLYTYPTSSTWDTIVTAKKNYPSLPIIAIINPSSGPGSDQDSNYSTGIQKLQSAGVTVLGYVATGYTQRSSTSVKADIDAYKTWYPGLSGIFFDEMANWSGGETYYKTLSDYAKSKGFSFTVGNPGADSISSYVGTVDNIIIYERAGVPSLSYLGGWHSNYDKSNFSIIPYAVSSLDESFVGDASSSVGYIYLTNDDLPNPWDSLPSYFVDLTSTVNVANSGSTSPPPASTYSVTIASADLAGVKFNGMWTTISKDGSLIKTGYTPLSFSAESGVAYQVTVSNYLNYIFDHWDNGSTNSARSISVSKDTTFTALYSTGQEQQPPQVVSLKVRSADMKGTIFTGVSTSISESGAVVKSGYTTLTFSAQSGLAYQITVSDMRNYKFDHWEDGKTSRTRTVNVGSDDILMTAYFTKGGKIR